LRALRLKGFKSFSKQTELLFEPGVAVVIGRNGSGKSNLSDAVMWVLGEQSPTSVRGSSMQDVIFAGSDGRRASGSAEVEITFDNSTGILPLPTAEVSVGRRVERDGDSKYFINRSSCRLTDVLELMAGLGLGKEMHTIIGQGKVESFLSSKPLDRRALIEEAAGLGRYKRRRERSEAKLREVRQNLERVDLLEKELTAQLTPLRRQANAAEQLRSLEQELEQTRGRLLAGRLEEADSLLAEARLRLETLDARRARLEAELAQISTTRQREEELFTRAIDERERRAKRLLRVRVLSGRLESCERLTAQRLRLAEELERAARAEHERLVSELAGKPEEPTPADWTTQETLLTAAVTAAEAEHAQVAARLTQVRQTLDGARAVVTKATIEREAALARADRLRARAADLEAEIGRHERQLAEVARSADERVATLTDTRARLSAAETDLRAARAAAEAAAAAAARAAAELAAADAALATRTRERRTLEAEAEHVQATLREVGDVDSEVLTVAQDFPGAIALSGAVVCAPGYERALAAALHQVAGALILPLEVDRWSLFTALRRAGVSFARLILPRPGRGAIKLFAGALPLAEKVTVNGPPSLLEALRHVVIVDDLRTVPEAFDGLVVTLEGAYYRPRDGELGLAGGTPTALLLERRAALEATLSRLADWREREQQAAAKVAELRAAAAVADEAASGTAQVVRAAQQTVDRARQAVSAGERLQRDDDDVRERAGRRLTALRAERDEALAEAAELERQAAAALLRLETATTPVATLETELADWQSEHDQSLAAVTQARIERDERRSAMQRAERERAAMLARAQAARARLVELEARLATLPPVRVACDDLALALAGVQRRAQALLVSLDAADAGTPSPSRAALGALADREASCRRDAEILAGERAEAQIAVARGEDQQAEVATRLGAIAERLEQAAFLPPESEAEADRLRARLERLERRRDGLGPVNPLAEAECAELSERAAFVREQRRDLAQSSSELLDLIKELTARIDYEFSETFAAVQAQFEQMIRILFPDGRGRLVLVESEVEGEPSGVAVEVKPARKLGKKLQLLSGGERSLVAIAFLMALVLSRPSPFYILDEIEAALDDINIGRFVDLVREYRRRTQFIIITHQKRTMEAADMLYGVTMGPDGTSRVVSARMAEEEIERERTGAPARAGGEAR
jgi:chromosome segregation protein